jgi:uncharacterized repeat protein (TIGR01451 family)
MRSKIVLGIVGTFFVVILVAALVPSTMAAGFGLDKQTYPDTLAKYHVGDTINYTIKATNTGSFNCTVDIWDILPDGTTKIYLDNDSYFSIGKVKWYNFSRTIESGWVDPNMKINNTVYAVGEDETTDTIDTKMTKTSTILTCPTAKAFANPSCFESGGSMITFDGSQSYAVSPLTIVNWSWSFSDGVKGSSDYSSVTSRVVDSTVTATLTVLDSAGCKDSASVSVEKCTDVPLLTPLGLIALIGALSAVLLVSKYRKVH